jgi:hypothetical protein
MKRRLLNLLTALSLLLFVAMVVLWVRSYRRALATSLAVPLAVPRSVQLPLQGVDLLVPLPRLAFELFALQVREPEALQKIAFGSRLVGAAGFVGQVETP